MFAGQLKDFEFPFEGGAYARRVASVLALDRLGRASWRHGLRYILVQCKEPSVSAWMRAKSQVSHVVMKTLFRASPLRHLY